jgi:hypothetical protein
MDSRNGVKLFPKKRGKPVDIIDYRFHSLILFDGLLDDVDERYQSRKYSIKTQKNSQHKDFRGRGVFGRLSVSIIVWSLSLKERKEQEGKEGGDRAGDRD